MRNLDELKKDAVNRLEELDDGGVNDWGSCQYAGAYAFYTLFRELRAKHSLEGVLKILEIELVDKGPKSFEQIKADILREQEDLEDECMVEEIGAANSVEGIVRACGDSGWDLWSAAPYVLRHCFDEFSFSGVMDAPGFGPIGNVAAQSENYTTGLCCALLFEYNLITFPDCFSGFST